MVEVIKSSFIPKKEIKNIGNNGNRKGSVNVFFLISLIIFLATIVGAVGMFFWRESLIKQIEKNKEIFKDKQDEYGLPAFKQFISFEKRLSVAKELLNNHYAIKPVFDFLEKNTISDVYYTDMDLKEDGEIIKLEFKGRASDFADLVWQKELYTKKSANISDFMFYNITKSKEDRVVLFDMSFNVNKEYLRKNILFSE